MKRNILAVILVLGAVFCAYGQNTNPIDLVLLLDTSTEMSASHEKVSEYITRAFLSEFLRLGDTFHLITFSSAPRLEIARRVAGRGDLETIIGRMFLHYPIEAASNAGAALAFVENYIAALPQRPKKVVMISRANPQVTAQVNASRQRLAARDTTLDFIEVTPGQPLSLPVSGRPRPAVQQPPAHVVQQPPPAVQQPPAAQQPPPIIAQQPPAAQQPQPPIEQAPDVITYPPNDFVDYPYDEITAQPDIAEDTDIIVRSHIPEAQPPARQERERREAEITASTLPLIIGIILGVILLLALIIFLASRRLGATPNRVMASVSAHQQSSKENLTPFADHSKDLAKYAARQTRRSTPYADKQKAGLERPVSIPPTGPCLLNLFVEDQNTAIGKRNIHSLKSGYSLSVGGGKSDYLIFLVPFPPNIGEIRRNGSQLTFVPRKSKYFPDLGSNELRDCLNKTIRIVSDKNYEVQFRFEMYEDPLVALNKLLMSVKVPG